MSYTAEQNSPYHGRENAANTVTAEVVLLKATTASSGTSTPVSMSKPSSGYIYQINDSTGAATVQIQGSLDGVNYATIASATGATVNMAVSVAYCPHIRVVWSGNTGTLSVVAVRY